MEMDHTLAPAAGCARDRRRAGGGGCGVACRRRSRAPCSMGQLGGTAARERRWLRVRIESAIASVAKVRWVAAMVGRAGRRIAVRGARRPQRVSGDQGHCGSHEIKALLDASRLPGCLPARPVACSGGAIEGVESNAGKGRAVGWA
jgi:hypothetical protein